jgi:hypothetical protein
MTESPTANGTATTEPLPASPSVDNALALIQNHSAFIRDDSNALALFQEDDNNHAPALVKYDSIAIALFKKTSATQEDAVTDEKSSFQDGSNAIVLQSSTQVSRSSTSTQEDATMDEKEREIYERDDNRSRTNKRTRTTTHEQFFSISSPRSLFDAAPPSLPDNADGNI